MASKWRDEKERNQIYDQFYLISITLRSHQLLDPFYLLDSTVVTSSNSGEITSLSKKVVTQRDRLPVVYSLHWQMQQQQSLNW